MSVHKQYYFQVDIKTLPHFCLSYTYNARLSQFTVKISAETVKTPLFGDTYPWEPLFPSSPIVVNVSGRLQAAKQSQVMGHHR